MIRHIAALVAASALIVGCMLLPFLPGGHDSLAVTLSAMSQLFAMAGLLLVPIGVAWLIHEMRLRRTTGAGRVHDRGNAFAFAALVAATLVAVVVSLGAAATVGPSLWLLFVLLCGYGVARLASRTKTAAERARRFTRAPVYLILLPIVAASAWMAMVGPAGDFARNRAIENSALLIADIEHYREVNGRYPSSLLSLWEDYKPGVIGISRYHYELNGDAYNVFFEVLSRELSAREIVMYNKLNQHEMYSHNMDRLRPRGGRGGYFAVRDMATPHWKRFFFD